MRDIVNSSGTVIDHIVYDSYGNILSETSPSNGDRFKFAGMEWDAAIGQYYDHARWYAEGIGRFTTQDPSRFTAGDSNLYRYVWNNPTDKIDHTGFSGGGDNQGEQQAAAEQAQQAQQQEARARIAQLKAEQAALESEIREQDAQSNRILVAIGANAAHAYAVTQLASGLTLTVPEVAWLVWIYDVSMIAAGVAMAKQYNDMQTAISRYWARWEIKQNEINSLQNQQSGGQPSHKGAPGP